MRLRSLCIATLLLTTTSVRAASSADGLADQWDAFLVKYVQPSGGVQYEAIAKDGRNALKGFLEAHAKLTPSTWDDAAKRAAYINFYNAGMMANVLRYADEQKVAVTAPTFLAFKINDLKVPGGNLWNASYNFVLAGKAVTLDNIEHDLIRGKGKDKSEFGDLAVKSLDPRIHSAVNCAAVSCPRVRETAYRAATIDVMLKENMNEFVSSEAQFAKLGEDKLRANSIVLWYYDDFDDVARDQQNLGGAGDLLAGFVTDAAKDSAWKKQHLKANFNDRSKVALRLSSKFEFQYDWRVNDVRNKK